MFPSWPTYLVDSESQNMLTTSHTQHMSWTHNLTSYSIQIVTHAPNMIWQVDFKIIPQKKAKKEVKINIAY